MVKPEGPQVIWRIGVACWISKATRTHAHKYVILTAFLRQQWFRERASFLLFHLSKFECTSYQPILVAGFSCSVNRIKPLISSCLQNMFSYLRFARDRGRGGEASARQPPIWVRV
jgi:hypothetical protein